MEDIFENGSSKSDYRRYLHPDGEIDESLIGNVFELQQEVLGVLGKADASMMRGDARKSASVYDRIGVEMIESMGERLGQCVLVALQTKVIKQNSAATLEDTRDIESNSRSIAGNIGAISAKSIAILENSASIAKSTRFVFRNSKAIQGHSNILGRHERAIIDNAMEKSCITDDV